MGLDGLGTLGQDFLRPSLRFVRIIGLCVGLTLLAALLLVLSSPARSVADLHALLAAAGESGPVVLVGHSWGGTVISEAGADDKVAALVYVAAFAPDAGESVAALIKDPPPGAHVPPILPPQDGYLLLDKAKFAASFAGDLDAAKAKVAKAIAALDKNVVGAQANLTKFQGQSTSLVGLETPWFSLRNPGLYSIPLGFLAVIIGSLLYRDKRAEDMWDELYVRQNTGLLATKATAH